jgi:hypothetical protein
MLIEDDDELALSSFDLFCGPINDFFVSWLEDDELPTHHYVL